MKVASLVWAPLSSSLIGTAAANMKTKRKLENCFYWPSVIVEVKGKCARVRHLALDNSLLDLDVTHLLEYRCADYQEFREYGFKSAQAVEFMKAMEEATNIECESDDDNDLPAVEDIYFQSSQKNQQTASRLSAESARTPRKTLEPVAKKRRKLPAVRSLIDTDEAVLAYWHLDRAYHPAKVIEVKYIEAIDNPNDAKYLVEFWDGVRKILPRLKLVTTSDDHFSSVQISDSFFTYIDDASCTDNLHDVEEVFKSRLQEIFPELQRIYQGEDASCERYNDFFAGGKRKQAIALQVGRGNFTVEQSRYVMQQLREKLEKDSVQSDDEYLGLLSTVLFPEAIIRLIQLYDNVSYDEAVNRMTVSLDWCSQLLADYHMQKMQNSHKEMDI